MQLDDDFITVRLHIPPPSDARRPTVISLAAEHSALLARGFLVATYRINWDIRNPTAPPTPPQENTVGKWILASPSAAVLGRDYLRMVATNADEVVPKVLDYLVTVPEVDAHRIGIAGASTNGFIALQAVAHDRRLAAASVLSACGDYHGFLRDSTLGMDGAPLALEPDYGRWLRGIEPIREPERVTHAAVLMVNRDGDPVIPIRCADVTAHVLRRAYARANVPDRFRYRVIESAVHGLDQRDAEESFSWLGHWLEPPGSTVR